MNSIEGENRFSSYQVFPHFVYSNVLAGCLRKLHLDFEAFIAASNVGKTGIESLAQRHRELWWSQQFGSKKEQLEFYGDLRQHVLELMAGSIKQYLCSLPGKSDSELEIWHVEVDNYICSVNYCVRVSCTAGLMLVSHILFLLRSMRPLICSIPRKRRMISRVANGTVDRTSIRCIMFSIDCLAVQKASSICLPLPQIPWGGWVIPWPLQRRCPDGCVLQGGGSPKRRETA